MATCYTCGAAVRPGEGFRRNVITSRSTRVSTYRRAGGSVSTTTGLRTLCDDCAAHMDQRSAGAGTRLTIAVVIGLACAILVTPRINGGSLLGALAFFFFLFGGPGWIAFYLLERFHENSIAASREEPTFALPPVSVPASAAPVPSPRSTPYLPIPVPHPARPLSLSERIALTRQAFAELENLGINPTAIASAGDPGRNRESAIELCAAAAATTLHAVHEYRDNIRTLILGLFASSVESIFARLDEDGIAASLEALARIIPPGVDEDQDLYVARAQETYERVRLGLNEMGICPD